MSKNSWNLFIDDERNLEDVTWAPWQIREKYRNEEWVTCRNYAQACAVILKEGCFPVFVSFDHDLGSSPMTGYDVAQFMVETDMDNRKLIFPPDFDFYVHSKNPIGKANIEGLLNSYLKHKVK